ncbi:DUF1589 domain-containing protein [Rhodopirellula bahusiensis]|uniref:DUF1589 domain-containing protein n=1 Tax=Rhodopirellula bahusiensis TaxID=2014065 RepID=UPI00117A27A4
MLCVRPDACHHRRQRGYRLVGPDCPALRRRPGYHLTPSQCFGTKQGVQPSR